ncbi:MAG: choice-of-anchor Q domain-containing protein, partial [Thermomicrobiales bacterium]
MRAYARGLLIVALLVTIASVGLAQPVSAVPGPNEVTVCSGDSAVAGSLPYVLNHVADGSTVVFDLDCTITLTTPLKIDLSDVSVNKLTNLTIDARATGHVHTIALDGGGTTAVLKTQTQAALPGPTVNLNGLTIQNGMESSTGSGGGILNDHGVMTITNSTIVNNHATSAGGGVYNNEGTLNITNSTIANNIVAGTDQAVGGGLANGPNGTLNVTSSTITGNHASNQDTVFSPTKVSGGGGIIDFQATPNKVTLTNTIVAGNLPGNCNGADIAISSTGIASGGHNLIGVNHYDAADPNCGQDFTGVTDGVNNDQVGTDTSPINPLLGTLGDHSGNTQTLPLLAGSPAIDKGTCAGGAPATDQRGVTRPQPVGGVCDIGAFESQGFTLSSPTGTPQMTATTMPFAAPLGVTVTANQPGAPFNEPINGGTVTFTIIPAGGAGATFGAKAGCTVSVDMLTATCAIVGGTAASPTLTANGTVGTYTATASAAGVSVAGNQTYQLDNVPGITLSPSTLLGGTVGIAYSQQLTASGGSGSGYTFAAPPASLPPGLTLSSAGLLSGTPMQAGPFTFTVTATDSVSNTGNKQYTVTIAAGATTTTVTVTPPSVSFSAATQSISLSATVTSSPPGGAVNEGTVTFTV